MYVPTIDCYLVIRRRITDVYTSTLMNYTLWKVQKTAYSVINSIHMKFEKWQSGMIAHRLGGCQGLGRGREEIDGKGALILGSFSGIMEISCIVMKKHIIVKTSLNYTLELGECLFVWLCWVFAAARGSLVEAYRFSYCRACVILVSWPGSNPSPLHYKADS